MANVNLQNINTQRGQLSYNGVNIFDLIYPTGSIIVRKDNANPETLFGGHWTCLGENVTLPLGSVAVAGASISGDGGMVFSNGLGNVIGLSSEGGGNPHAYFNTGGISIGGSTNMKYASGLSVNCGSVDLTQSSNGISGCYIWQRNS